MALLRKKYWGRYYKLAKQIVLECVPENKHEELKNIGVADLQLKWVCFPHPETDIEDNSLGVGRKTLRKLIQAFGEEGTVKIFRAIAALSYAEFVKYERDSDGFVDWNTVFKQTLKKNVQKWTLFVIEAIKENITSQKERLQQEATELIRLNEAKPLQEAFIEAVSTGSLIGIFNDVKVKNALKSFREAKYELYKRQLTEMLVALGGSPDNKSKWEQKKITPYLEEIMLLDPETVIGKKSVLPLWQKVFGVKQIAKMSPEKRHLAILLAAINPSIREIIAEEEILEALWSAGKNMPQMLSKRRMVLIKKASKIVENSTEAFKILLLKSDEELRFLASLPKKGVLDIAKYFNYSTKTAAGISALYRHLISLKTEVFDKRENDSLIPDISGEVDDYRFSTIAKDDPWGLFCGYSVDNCQVYGGAGSSCLKAGFESKRAGFIGVWNKKGYMVAEIYTWKVSYNSNAIVLDSIEALGQNSGSVPQGVVKACGEAIIRLLEEGLDVYIGINSGIGIQVAAYVAANSGFHNEDLEDCDISGDAPSGYTDTGNCIKFYSAT